MHDIIRLIHLAEKTMNSLEASLELLKLIIASEKFVNLDLAQRTEIVLNSFQTIYERVCEMKVNSVLEDFEAKTDRKNNIMKLYSAVKELIMMTTHKLFLVALQS